MIPPITLIGPWYLLFRDIGLYNTLTGLVLTHDLADDVGLREHPARA